MTYIMQLCNRVMLTLWTNFKGATHLFIGKDINYPESHLKKGIPFGNPPLGRKSLDPNLHKVVTRVFPGSVFRLKLGFEAFHDKPLVKTKRGTKWGIYKGQPMLFRWVRIPLEENVAASPSANLNS